MGVDRSKRNPADTQAKLTLLGALVDRYSRPLNRYFSRRVDTVHDVPDLVQEVFLRLSKLEEADSIQHHESFIFVVASNVLKDQYRRRQARIPALPEPLEEIQAESSDFAPDRVLESKQVAMLVRQALEELPERTRDIFVLRMLEGMKMAEVALAMKISTRAAEKHQARALAHVAGRLKDWRLD